MPATAWAILLCKFSDVLTEPYPRRRYEEIFTTAGAGKFNMVDFFRDMSHGHVDLGGSHVFGWYTLDKKQSDYTGSGANPAGRNALISWARQAAAKAGDDLSGFFNVVVTTSAPSDLFGGLGGVVADDDRDGMGMTDLSPSLLGQEMGHGYGLNHSRTEGSEEDRTDRWDVMSTRNACFMARHPVYTELDDRGRPIFRIGPGLNAANMWGMGWLDLTRTWTGGWDDTQKQGTVELRPLHRLDLPGYLCARIGDFFIEFRMNELWDARLPAPVVLIHDYPDGHSYIHRGKSHRADLIAGDSFRWGSDPTLPVHGAGFEITVSNIDANARTATIQYDLWSSNVPGPVGPGIPFGGVANDGGGWVIVNGRVTPVPPRSPEFTLLELIVEARAGQGIRNGVARGMVLRQTYEAIGGIAAAQTAEIQSYREPAPPSMQVEQTERETDTPG